jgi:hypothetical protein
MNEDPDDLATAFFAAQAAKEAQKAKLPTNDWVDVISSNLQTTYEQSNANAAHDGMKDNDIASSVNEWLVMTIPAAPSCHDGEIELNPNECSCDSLLKKYNQSESRSATNSAEDEKFNATRECLKQAIVQKLLKESI